MRQRGRKSGAGLGILQVDGKPNRLDPPTSLSAAERAIFFDVVAACDREHFRPSDLLADLLAGVRCTCNEKSAAPPEP